MIGWILFLLLLSSAVSRRRTLTFSTIQDVLEDTRSSYDIPTVKWREKNRRSILRSRHPEEPLLIKNIVEEEDMLLMWNPESLAENTKDTKWRTYISGVKHLAKYNNTDKIGMTLHDYLQSKNETCQSEYRYPRYPARYLSGFNENEVSRKLKILSMGGDDFEPIVRVSKDPIQYGAHYDENHNHLLQLFGRKRVVLVPHEYVKRLRIDPETRHTGVNILVDPALLDVPALQVILTPGDALYIPAWMIHYTEALELNVALNQFTTHKRR